MKIKRYASGKRTITMSRLEWIKIGKQLGFDMSHKDFERTFVDGFIGKFSTILGTLKQLQKQILNKKEIQKDRIAPVFVSDINYLKSLNENMPDSANGLKDTVDDCLENLNKCIINIGVDSSYSIINSVVAKIERVMDILKNKLSPTYSQNGKEIKI